MRFSFVIPVYNVENYLVRCLDSVINQTYRDFEVIIIDDGSTDSCPEICDDYAKQDKRICAIHQKNQGLSMARNVGVEAAKGDYIFFVDSDDYLETNALERLIPYTEENRKVVSINTTAEPIVHEARLYTSLECLGEGFIRIASWSYIYLRSFLLDNNLRFEPGLYEDTLFTPTAIYKSGSVYVTNLPLYHYEEKRKDSISNSSSERHLADYLKMLKNLNALYSNPDLEEVKQLRMQIVISFYITMYFQQKGSKYGRKYAKALKPYIKEKSCNTKFLVWTRLFCFSPTLYRVVRKYYAICKVKNRCFKKNVYGKMVYR